jgi:Fur family ferric uptake transcriptional regulator
MSSADFEGPLHQVAEARLRLIEQRYTAGRRAIVELLRAAGRHLTDLQAAGLVRRVAASDEFARFELAEDLTEHHHHLLCVRCGKVTDVTPSPEFELHVSVTVDELAAAEGFEPQGHRLDVLGVCAACR